MSDCPNKVEFQVPRGKLIVRHAKCPNGCDLMDEDVQIHGHPSIQVRLSFAGGEGQINLDPVYGKYENIAEAEVPDGTIVELACPGCGVSLKDAELKCSTCSAPTFALHLPGGGVVEGCLRMGCPAHSMRIVTGEQVMQRIFDETGMDAFL